MNVALNKAFIGVNMIDCDVVVHKVHREQDEENVRQGWLEAGRLRVYRRLDEERALRLKLTKAVRLRRHRDQDAERADICWKKSFIQTEHHFESAGTTGTATLPSTGRIVATTSRARLRA